MTTAFFGPFIGEFGWELFGWQSYLRVLAKQHDKIIVSSRPQYKFLYEDFCTEFVPYDPNNFFSAGWTCYGHKYKGGLHKRFSPDVFVHFDTEPEGLAFIEGKQQEFIKYGKQTEDKSKNIAIHARMMKVARGFKEDRNWPAHQWDRLATDLTMAGYNVTAIGLPGHAYLPAGATNKLGIELKELADLLANSKVIVGPSSGPMHFATLCGCPQFVWTSNEPGLGWGNREVYETKWNPFKTDVLVYEDEGWQPTPAKLLPAIESFLEVLP